MKASGLSAIVTMLSACSLIVAASAFAGNTNRKTLQLSEKAEVHGTLLKPGEYKVEWNGSGPNVVLNILQGRDTVATVPARIVPERTSHEHDGYVLRTGKNGSSSIKEIFFGGTKYDLEIKSPAKAS